MEEKLLTISIAAYNMEKFIECCVGSVLIPKLCPIIEVLIVNDGSTDNTLSIALDYQKRYPDTVRVIDKQNGGYGSVTNTAIDTANGKYFKTLDADDWFDTKNFERIIFIEHLKTVDVDLIITNYSRKFEPSITSYPIRYTGVKYGKIFDFNKFCIMDKTGMSGFAMHAITYRSEILKIDGFRVSECYYSDVDYSVYPLINVKSVVFFDLILYKYRIGRAEQSVGSVGLVRHFNDHLYVCKKLVDYYTDYQAENNATISLNIGYNAAEVVSNLISVMFGQLYYFDRDRAKKQTHEFMLYLQGRDSDLLELATDRVAYFGKVIALREQEQQMSY